MITAFNYHFSGKTEALKACTKISGVGKRMAQQALDRIGIGSHVKVGKLSASQLSKIKAVIDQNYDTNSELLSLVKQNIDRLSSISSYRGFRHYQGLPCRGQRTHSNAKTCRKQRRK